MTTVTHPISTITFTLLLTCLSAPALADLDLLKHLSTKVPHAVIETAATNRPPATSPIEPEALSPPGPMVADKERDTLIQKIGEFDAATTRSAATYEHILFGVTLGSIILGLGASIAAFCKRSTLAGILSIMAAGILGIGTAMPIAQSADFYRLLSAQSHALRADAELSSSMTVSEFTIFRQALRTLILFEGDKFPSRSNTQEATQNLLAQIMSARAESAPR